LVENREFIVSHLYLVSKWCWSNRYWASSILQYQKYGTTTWRKKLDEMYSYLYTRQECDRRSNGQTGTITSTHRTSDASCDKKNRRRALARGSVV